MIAENRASCDELKSCAAGIATAVHTPGIGPERPPVVAADLPSRPPFRAQHPGRADGPKSVASWRVSVAGIQAELTQVLDRAIGEEQLLTQLAQLVAVRLEADWVALQTVGAQGGADQLAPRRLAGRDNVDAALLAVCLDTAVQAADTGRSVTGFSAGPPPAGVVATPVPGRHAVCLVTIFSPAAEVPAMAVTVLQLAAANMARWDAEARCRQHAAESRRIAALAEIVSRLESSPDVDQAGRVLVEQLQKHFGCDRVIVGFCRSSGSTCHVTAVSGAVAVDSSSESVRRAQAVLQESIARGEISAWPPLQHEDRHGLCAHRQYVEYVNAEAVVSVVLRDESGVVRGAWLMSGQRQTLQDLELLNFVTAAFRPLASAIGLLLRAQQNRLQRLLSGCQHAVRQRRGATMLAVCGAFCGVLLIPVPWRVACDCELQPVTRRHIAAPFAGRLDQSFVKPGDIVSIHDVLARLDEREIQWELAAAEADMHRVSKERAGYLAAHESGKAQIAELEVQRLRMQIELLRDRRTHLQILSPVDGIVVAGDLQRSVGMALEIGQPLFEVAPLDRMVVELAIPEEEIRLMYPGIPVRIWLDAFPGQNRDAVVERIHPRAELKNHVNVFVAEVCLANTDGSLRPGMRGNARITTERRPLGWNLFHKAVWAAIRWLGW